MNNNRRKRLREIEEALDKCWSLLSDIFDEETECLDNIPENLQDTDRCEKMRMYADSIEDACGFVEEALSSVREAL